MNQYASGLKWCLSEQDRDGRQTRKEIQITHWSKEGSLISLFNNHKICEHKISIKELKDLGSHGYDRITLSSAKSVVILRNTGDKGSGGLLVDFLNCLVESIKIDNKPQPSKTVLVDPPASTKDPIAKFLETYLQSRS